MALELLADALELGVDGRHVGRHLGDLRGGPDACHDVLALRVGQVLAVQHALAGVRVAGERDAGAGVIAHVPEDHRDDVHGGAEVVGDPLVLAVVRGALAEPRREDRLDREVQLLVGVLGEVAAGVRLDDGPERIDELAQCRGVEVGVLARAVRRLGRLERMVEPLAVHAEHDPTEHLDEPAIGVPAESLVAGEVDQALQGPLVEPQVEDGVHHPGHRELGPGPDADEQRVGRVAEALAGPALDLLDRVEDVVPEAVGQPLTGGEVVVAGLGGDREPGRRRQPGERHLGEAGPLATEQVAHPGVAFGTPLAPRVDVALRRAVRAVGSRAGSGHRGNLRVGRRAGLGRPAADGRFVRGDCTVALRAATVATRCRAGTGPAGPSVDGRRIIGRPPPPTSGVRPRPCPDRCATTSAHLRCPTDDAAPAEVQPPRQGSPTRRR